MKAICLVIFGDRGSHLVFHFPPPEEEKEKPATVVAPVHATVVSQEAKAHPYALSRRLGAKSTPAPSSAPSTSTHRLEQNVYGMPPKVFARMFCPKAALCGQVLEVVIDDLRFISHPVLLPVDSRHETTFFNIIFVLKNDERNCEMYKDIATKLAKAVEHEQNRNGFLTQEVQKMLSIRDE